MSQVMKTSFLLLIAIANARASSSVNKSEAVETTEFPEPLTESTIYYVGQLEDQEGRISRKNITAAIEKSDAARTKNQKRTNSTLNEAIRVASIQGLNAMIDLYERKEPEILRKGQAIKRHINPLQILDAFKNISGEFLDVNHPAAKLSLFSAPMTNETDAEVKGAYASLVTAKKLQERWDCCFCDLFIDKPRRGLTKRWFNRSV